MIGILICIIAVILLIYFIFFFKEPTPIIVPPPLPGDEATKLNLKIMANRTITIENIVKTDSKTYEFEVYAEGDNFELTSYQAALGFNQNIINGGVLTFQYLTGTSGINNPPSFGLGVNSTDGPKELTFGSGPGSDFITTKVRLGKFRLTNSVDYNTAYDLGLSWNFSGYINTIFTGTGFNDITNTLLFNIIVGDMNMITINESQKVLLTAEPLSAKGNVAPIDGAVVWTVVTGSAYVSMSQVDNTSAYAIAVGPVGTATIQAKADADLTTGSLFITNEIQIEVIGGQAVTLNIIAGTPVAQ